MSSNIIDRQFDRLMREIDNKSIEDIKEMMLSGFRKLSDANRKVLKDYFDKYSFWGTLHDSISDHDFLYKKATSLHDHFHSYLWLYSQLSDYRSKAVLFGVLSNWLHFSFMTEYKEPLFKDYFDIDIMKCDKNEVFIDAGAYIGDTSLSYIETFGSENYKRIYCYEITPSIFSKLQNNMAEHRNIVCRNVGLSDFQGALYMESNGVNQSNKLINDAKTNDMVNVTTLDMDVEESVSFIKMDIEGSEKQALAGSKKHIQSSKPKLAIAVYHDNDDLWKIPQMIKDMNPEYKLYLRYNGLSLYPTETTMIAV